MAVLAGRPCSLGAFNCPNGDRGTRPRRYDFVTVGWGLGDYRQGAWQSTRHPEPRGQGFFRNRPVPAAQRSFIAKSRTSPEPLR